jgi:hypothetical protein
MSPPNQSAARPRCQLGKKIRAEERKSSTAIMTESFLLGATPLPAPADASSVPIYFLFGNGTTTTDPSVANVFTLNPVSGTLTVESSKAGINNFVGAACPELPIPFHSTGLEELQEGIDGTFIIGTDDTGFDQLVWSNDVFGGSARFCLTNGGGVYAFAAAGPSPSACDEIELGLYG